MPSGSSPLGGILLFSLGIFLFSLNDALGKWLLASFSVGELMLLRTIGAAVILVPLVWRLKPTLRPRSQIGLHVARVVCMACDSFCFYAATTYLPLADVMTFYMASPLIVTVLSVVFLRERVRPSQWAAVVLGFIGVLIALRPSGATISAGALIALLGSSMFSLGLVSTRQLREASWLPLVVYQFAFAGVIGAVTAPIGWQAPGLTEVLMMALVGIVSMACFMCLNRALASAPASLLAPFQYFAIVWAALLGWLVWRDVPSVSTIVGNAVIIGGGLFVVAGERLRAGGSAISAE